MTHALILLAVVAVLAVAVAAWIVVSMFKKALKKHGGGHMVWWFVSGHHYGGKRTCCEKHCTPAVRWRRARRRLAPFSIATGVIVALVMGLGLFIAVPVGILAGVIALYPRRGVRVARVLAAPPASAVAKRISIPSIPAPKWAGKAIAPAAPMLALTRHQREVVRPMATALAPVLEMPARHVRKALSVPVAWQKPDAELGLKVLPGWSATLDRQQFIEREVSQRLPGIEWGANYQLGGSPARPVHPPAGTAPGSAPGAGPSGP